MSVCARGLFASVDSQLLRRQRHPKGLVVEDEDDDDGDENDEEGDAHGL